MVATQQQSLTISRRALDIEDYIDIGRRHVGWIVGPAFAGLVIATAVAFVLPNQYTSKATMEITPAQISSSLVPTTVVTQLNERIMEMQQEILSRQSLSQIIQDPHLNLYSEDRKTKPIEDVIEDMKKDINIEIISLPGQQGKQVSAFNISFTYVDRYKTQQTVQQLMTKFDDANQSTQRTQQKSVREFVTNELGKAKADLGQANDALTKFKEDNAGRLPDSVQLNIARENSLTTKMQAAQEELFAWQEKIGGLDNQKATLEARIQFNEEMAAQVADTPLPGTPEARQNQELALLDKQIEQEEANLELLRKRYKDNFPGVKDVIDQLELNKRMRDQKALQVKAQQAAADEALKSRQPTKKPIDPKVAEAKKNLEDQLVAIASTRKTAEDRIKYLQDQVNSYKKDSDEVSRNLKESTGLEGQYADLKNQVALAESRYQDLEKKNQVAEANTSLLEQRAGENLDVLDAPNVPQQATKPNRYLIVGAGLGISVFLGLGLAAMQEAKDTSLKNLKDVRAYTNLPVLCSIPLLENTMLVRRKKRLSYLAWSAAVLAGAGIITGAVIYYETVTLAKT